MPKSADVEDFAAKLALLTKRLNWSRAKLAQQVGVDKSLAARWLNGNSRPTGNSLMLLTTAVAQSVEGFTAADWDLAREQFARRLGIEPGAAHAASSGPTINRAALIGLRNPPPASTWGAAYVGLWAGFYQSLTNRGVARLCAAELAVEDDRLRFDLTEGFFLCEGSAIATHTHLHAICEIKPLDNHLLFFTLNAAHDLAEVAVIDGLISGVGPDHTPVASPLLLFRIDDTKVAALNERIEGEAARTRDPFADTQQLAPVEILRMLCPVVGSPRSDGEIDHVLRVPPKRSLATGKRTMGNLPADAPLRLVRTNLRRALGLDAVDNIRLVHLSKS
jgi:hypothetical protein